MAHYGVPWASYIALKLAAKAMAMRPTEASRRTAQLFAHAAGELAPPHPAPRPGAPRPDNHREAPRRPSSSRARRASSPRFARAAPCPPACPYRSSTLTMSGPVSWAPPPRPPKSLATKSHHEEPSSPRARVSPRLDDFTMIAACARTRVHHRACGRNAFAQRKIYTKRNCESLKRRRPTECNNYGWHRGRMPRPRRAANIFFLLQFVRQFDLISTCTFD